MFLLIPVQTEVVFQRWPIMNFVLIGTCVLSYISFNILNSGDSIFYAMILDGWSPVGLVGHVFLHADFIHLLGNMIFLWVFGNALNERMGQVRYLLFFILAGVVSGMVHTLLDTTSALGASGAVNGVVGAYLILYPTNRVSLFWILFIKGGIIQISGYWLIGFWFIQDVIGAIVGNAYIAYWAHIGGIVFGISAGCILLKRGSVKLSSFDNPDLLTILKLHSPIEKKIEPRNTELPQEIGFNCPDCGKPQRIYESQIGGQIHCWSCRTPIFLEEDI